MTAVRSVPTPTRARLPLFGAKPPDGREARVRVIMDLMLSGRFVTGKTGKAMARLWGFSDYYLRDLAAEASRRAKALVDPEYVRGRLSRSLENGLGVVDRELADPAAICWECGRSSLDAVKALPGVVNSYRDLVGAGAASKLELTGKNGGAIPVAVSVVDARELAWLAVVADELIGDGEAYKVPDMQNGADVLSRIEARLMRGGARDAARPVVESVADVPALVQGEGQDVGGEGEDGDDGE